MSNIIRDKVGASIHSTSSAPNVDALYTTKSTPRTVVNRAVNTIVDKQGGISQSVVNNGAKNSAKIVDTTDTKAVTRICMNKNQEPIEAFYATGKRKTSIARVWIAKGTGKVVVNNKSADEYFSSNLARDRILSAPFKAAGVTDQYDVKCTASGGGLSGQIDAISLGVARALVKYNQDLKPMLRAADLMTRDSRIVERKKYGQHGARKKTQFSKR